MSVMYQGNHLKIVGDNGSTATVCIDRTTGTVIVLRADVDMLGKVSQIIAALKAPPARILVAADAVDLIKELTDAGWVRANVTVFEK